MQWWHALGYSENAEDRSSTLAGEVREKIPEMMIFELNFKKLEGKKMGKDSEAEERALRRRHEIMTCLMWFSATSFL